MTGGEISASDALDGFELGLFACIAKDLGMDYVSK